MDVFTGALQGPSTTLVPVLQKNVFLQIFC